jgi:DNA-binding CsgD family transcriptional regulator
VGRRGARTFPRDIVGRSAELDAIDTFLIDAGRAASALVLEGEAGIGKTTVWEQVFARAASRGISVVSCRPAEAETKLAFASLADLLDPVADDVLPRLPEPQRRALEVALMRTGPLPTAPSARAVSMAVLSTLRVLTHASPLVLAIDDQQWLDRASAEALAFALRRIGDRPVGVVATSRVTGQVRPDPLRLGTAFAGRVERVTLGPLGLGALHHVIRANLGLAVSRPALRRITDASGGNPFFALEYARAFVDAGARIGPGEPLPVPETTVALVFRRVERLPARVRRLLLVASALATPTVAVVEAVLGDGDLASSLVRAEQAGVIEIRGREIRFAHPLLASAVYSSAAARTRQAIHRDLAGVISSPEERARHLALATPEPDEQVARALDDASLLARRRGAPDAAGELQESAANVTPRDDPAAARRRRIAAAEHFFHAGDRARARALLESLLAGETECAERARALHLLGQIRGHEDSFVDAIRHLTEALALADGPAASLPIRRDLAFVTFNVGDLAGAIAIAQQALADAERLGDPGSMADALCIVVMGDFLAGRGCDHAALQRALALEDRDRAGQLLMRPASVAGILALLDGRLSEAEELLRAQCDWASQRGEESELPFLLFSRARLEWWRGDFDAAAGHAEEVIAIASQTGSETMRLVGLAWRAAARAGRGDVAGARADMQETRALIDRTGYAQGEVFLRMHQAALESSLGDAAAAERALAPLLAAIEASASGTRPGETAPFGIPVAGFFLPDAVEALAALGHLARAVVLLDWFARRADQLDRWAPASVARCRSVLDAARGDLDAGAASAQEAVARWRELEMPIELGRALLVLGRVRRRRNERRLARQALAEAHAIFQRQGARLWAERATEELSRVPIRRGAPEDLTPTEEQVAALVAAGRTNREVAKALFMSPKTVEANLTRIYGKLDIHSRAELGVRLLERRPPGTPKK